MAGETTLTVVGQLGGDPELRFSASGKAVVNFSLASTPRKFNRESREWEDGDTLWLRVSIWDKYAENVAESLVKGDRVVVTGRLVQRSWEDDQGNKRTAMELQAEEVAPTLRFRSFPHRAAQAGSTAGTTQRERPSEPETDSPWNTGGGGDDQPPF